MTAEQCWAGACCCFTMRQKIAWAAEHDFVPPEHAVRIAEEEAVTEESDCPHCKADKAKKAKAALANRSSAKLWTVTQFASDCQGKGMIGAFSTQPSLPIESTTAYSLDRPFTGVLPTVETIIFPIFEEISVPPPK